MMFAMSGEMCRRKQLEGLGHRLLDRFKGQYELKKKKKHKEKRNSTKKELREDGIALFIDVVLFLEFNVSRIEVVVVVVVMMSTSGTAYMGGQMSQRDEEFHQTLNPEGSISPS